MDIVVLMSIVVVFVTVATPKTSPPARSYDPDSGAEIMSPPLAP